MENANLLWEGGAENPERAAPLCWRSEPSRRRAASLILAGAQNAGSLGAAAAAAAPAPGRQPPP